MPVPRRRRGQKAQHPLHPLRRHLGWSDSTLFGTTKLYQTPNIERLATRGMLFHQAYAHPMCSPTRSSIMSGLWPARTGMTEAAGHLEEVRLAAEAKTQGDAWQKVAAPWGATRLDTRYRTIAEVLKEAGYATGHFAKWHLGREPYDPLHRGFDVDIPHTYGPMRPSFYAPWKWPPGVKYDSGNPGEYLDDRMADEAIKFMKAHRGEPFFCNFWMFSPHGGPSTTPELEAKYEKKILALGPDYPQRNPETAGLHQELDRVVGRLVKAVDELNLADNTIIIFNSDNGGWVWPSGNRKDVGMTSNAPLRSGKSSLYEGGTRVPLIFVWPGKIKPGAHSDAIFSSVDFYPTILAMLGLQPVPGQKLDGIDQVPALLGGAAPRDTTFCFFPHYDRDQMGPGAYVRRGDWKLIMRFCDNDDQTDRHELYNLREDIGETRNLAAQQADKVSELDALLRQYLKDTGAVLPVKNPKYDSKAKAPTPGNPKQAKPRPKKPKAANFRLKMEEESDAGV